MNNEESEETTFTMEAGMGKSNFLNYLIKNLTDGSESCEHKELDNE